MKSLFPQSQREQLLIVILMLSVAVAAYLMLRIKPLQIDMQVLQEQLGDSIKAMNNTRPMRPGPQNAATLEEKATALQLTIDQELKTLAGFKKSFIDLSQNNAIASMRKNITQLAEKNQLRLLSIQASNIALDSLAGVTTLKDEDALARPLFDIKFRGGFFQLNQFLTELKSLPYTVVVTKLSLSTEAKENTRQNNTSVLALFTLAF